MQNRKYDLEERLVDYTCRMIDVVEALPTTRAGNYISGQLVRSCHSPAFNYGEAQGAESPKDFVHKLGVVLKELRETLNCLKILAGSNYLKYENPAIKECNELVSIFVKSVETNKKKLEQGTKPSAIDKKPPSSIE